MTDERRQAFSAEPSEMDLEAVAERLAKLDEEVRAASEVEEVEEVRSRRRCCSSVRQSLKTSKKEKLR